jgi:hypothetical protein
MNYYIQGDAANADKIKAAFEKLGYDTSGHLFNAKSVLYFTLDGGIRATTCNCTPAIIKTHPDYKELELPVEPKFKVGDDIKTGNTIETIVEVDYTTRSYCCESGRTIWFENQDLWHLVPKPHYDISKFNPFDKVLVRYDDSCTWGMSFFGRYDGMFICCSNICFTQCIPFNDDTKHLLGTTDMCDECYINW